MAPRPTAAEARNPRMQKEPSNVKEGCPSNLIASRKAPPATAGIESRNEKRTASLADKPLQSPPVMVLPLLEIPGIRATLCKAPIHKASFQEGLCDGLIEGLDRRAAKKRIKAVMSKQTPKK